MRPPRDGSRQAPRSSGLDSEQASGSLGLAVTSAVIHSPEPARQRGCESLGPLAKADWLRAPIVSSSARCLMTAEQRSAQSSEEPLQTVTDRLPLGSERGGARGMTSLC